jgi:hypothetical protein
MSAQRGGPFFLFKVEGSLREGKEETSRVLLLLPAAMLIDTTKKSTVTFVTPLTNNLF